MIKQILLCFMFLCCLYSTVLAIEEDFDDYTEVDPGFDISKTSDTITFTNMPRNVNSYVYYDYTANYFVGNYKILLNAKCTRPTSSGGLYCFWGFQNVEGCLMPGAFNTPSHMIRHYNHSAGPFVYLNAQEAAGLGSDVATVGYNTDYWYTIIRNELVGDHGTLTTKIYSDATRTTLHDTLLITLTEKINFRYAYGLSSYNSGHANTTSGYVKNMSVFVKPDSLTTLLRRRRLK